MTAAIPATAQEKWQPLAPEIWSLSYQFKNMGLASSTRMTLIRLSDGSLLAHSAVPLTPEQRAGLDELGPLRFIIAPSAMHHLFVSKVARLYPEAQLYGPASVLSKRKDLPALQLLPAQGEPAPWAADLSCMMWPGIPVLDESVWFHHATGSLIVTDILQCWQGPLGLTTRLYLGLTGGHERLTVPRTVRLLVKDKAAVRASAQALLKLPVQRVILLHNSMIEDLAAQRLAEALSIWTTA